MEPTPTPDDPVRREFHEAVGREFIRKSAIKSQLRALDAMFGEIFTKPADRRVADTAAELDEMVAELRDLIAQMRGTLAELRALRTKREAYKPWH